MEKVESKTLKQRKASEIFGLSLRHTQRLIRAYRDEGPKRLISKKRGKPNPRRTALEKRNKIVERIKERHPDFDPTFAGESRERVFVCRGKH